MAFDENCVFCAKVRRGDYLELYPEWSTARFEPLDPVTPGHMLFVPAEHVANAPTGPQVFSNVARAAAEYAQRQEAACNIITSAGSLATQTVWHLHVHYVPRRPDDGLPLPWTEIEVEVGRDGCTPVMVQGSSVVQLASRKPRSQYED